MPSLALGKRRSAAGGNSNRLKIPVGFSGRRRSDGSVRYETRRLGSGRSSRARAKDEILARLERTNREINERLKRAERERAFNERREFVRRHRSMWWIHLLPYGDDDTQSK